MKKAARSYDSSKRKAQAAERRQHIVACAAELFLSHRTEELTLETVAQRAGTTVQTILRGFGSRDGLMIAVLEVAGPSDPERLAFGSVEKDGLQGAIKGLFDVYEQIGDLVIRMLGEEQRSPQLHETVEIGRVYHKDWVRKNFAPWLHDRSPAEEVALFHALLTATDIYVWKILRRDEALGLNTAIASVVLTIESLLGANKK